MTLTISRQAVELQAYASYQRRKALGLPDDAYADWVFAVQQLKRGLLAKLAFRTAHEQNAPIEIIG